MAIFEIWNHSVKENIMPKARDGHKDNLCITYGLVHICSYLVDLGLLGTLSSLIINFDYAPLFGCLERALERYVGTGCIFKPRVFIKVNLIASQRKISR